MQLFYDVMCKLFSQIDAPHQPSMPVANCQPGLSKPALWNLSNFESSTIDKQTADLTV